MTKVTLGVLFLSFGIMGAGSAGGWAITYDLAGKVDAIAFVYWSIAILGSIFLLQCILYSRAKARLYFQLLFLAAFGLSVAWFMMCLVLPILWIEALSIYARAGLLLVAIPLCACNIGEAFRRFSDKWAGNGDAFFTKAFNRERGTVEWDRVAAPLKLAGTIFIPGVPKRLTSIISLLIVPSMLLGLGLRNVYPVFSIFAWGIPSLLIVAFFFQMIGYNLAQAAEVRRLEEKVGKVIKPVA